MRRIIFDLGFADTWKKELRSMNKIRRPFDFPSSYIEFLSFLKVGFDISYRMVEGAVGAVLGFSNGFYILSITTGVLLIVATFEAVLII